MNTFIKHRLTAMAVVFGLLVSTFGFVNQPQPAAASISKPRVTMACQGSVLFQTRGCWVFLDREATAGLAYLRKVGRMSSDQIINTICAGYGTQFSKAIQDELTTSFMGIELQYTWYPDCTGTLTALSWWHNPDLGKTLDVNAAFGGCLAVALNVSGVIRELINNYQWWPPPWFWEIWNYQWSALNHNSALLPVPYNHYYCYAR